MKKRPHKTTEEEAEIQSAILKYLYDNRIKWIDIQAEKRMFGVSWRTLYSASRGEKTSNTTLIKIANGLGFSYDMANYEKYGTFKLNEL